MEQRILKSNRKFDFEKIVITEKFGYIWAVKIVWIKKHYKRNSKKSANIGTAMSNLPDNIGMQAELTSKYKGIITKL